MFDSVLFTCPTVPSKEFIVVDYNNVRASTIMAGKEVLEFVQSSKNITDAGFDDENENNKAAPVPTSSEMRNIMKIMHNVFAN
ncbi:hypothetical protein TNCV_3061501 [Trichonephila clavipes]|nr:hypothetical protein TNCV_3061501 [Trichonephila clavipes]